METQEEQPTKEHPPKKDNEDFALSGMLFTFILLAVLGFMIYLLSVKSRTPTCVPKLDANGKLMNNCTPAAVSPAPAGSAPGQIQFLPGLNQQQQRIPQLDGQ